MQNAINPYIAGSPVRDREMYFGRERVFEVVRQCLVGSQPPQIVVLHGQRRIGKTSTLYQMAYHLPETYIPVLVDLQGLSLDGLPGLLWEVAQVIRRQLRRTVDLVLAREDREEWLADAAGNVHRFLASVAQALDGRHVVLMFDETMLLADKIAVGALEDQVFATLGDLMSCHTFLDFVFSIGSQVGMMQQELTGFPRAATYVEIGFLELDAARALIQEPVRGTITYSTDAVEYILALTSGQPYYTQLVCHELFEHVRNAGRQDVALADVEAVRPGVVEMATAQLHYVWDETPPLGQHVLLALAEIEERGERVFSVGQIGRLLLQHGIMAHNTDLEHIVDDLYKRKIIYGSNYYIFHIELFRHWIMQHQRLAWIERQL